MKDQIKVHFDIFISEAEWTSFKSIPNENVADALRKAISLWTLVKQKEQENQTLALLDKSKKIKAIIKNT